MSDTGKIADDMRRLCSLLDEGNEASHAVSVWAWENVAASDCLPRELPPELSALLERLCRSTDTARSIGNTLFDRLCSAPVALYLNGYLLTHEQFHLLAAQGIMFDCTYNAFRMLHYEDDDRRCYINPNETPLPPPEIDQQGGIHQRVGLRLGKPPEEILWNRLRPEQQDYFQQYLPEIAARFRREE